MQTVEEMAVVGSCSRRSLGFGDGAGDVVVVVVAAVVVVAPSLEFFLRFSVGVLPVALRRWRCF